MLPQFIAYLLPYLKATVRAKAAEHASQTATALSGSCAGSMVFQNRGLAEKSQAYRASLAWQQTTSFYWRRILTLRIDRQTQQAWRRYEKALQIAFLCLSSILELNDLPLQAENKEIDDFSEILSHARLQSNESKGNETLRLRCSIRTLKPIVLDTADPVPAF